jgi:hypothetical protein
LDHGHQNSGPIACFSNSRGKNKNHDLERDLFIEERKAERNVYLHQLIEEFKKAPWNERLLIAWWLLVHTLWIAVMFFYLVLSNYGRDLGLPFVWWLARS